MKRVSYVMFAIAVALSYWTVGITCFSYAEMLCAIAHKGASAPANIVFCLILLPYGLATLIFSGLGVLFYRKGKQNV